MADFSVDGALFDAMKMTLVEAISNAIEHGNRFESGKQVHLRAGKERGVIVFVVEDEGRGFDLTEIESPLKEENLLKTRGRGIFLMKQYADAVQYNNTGNILTLKFKSD